MVISPLFRDQLMPQSADEKYKRDRILRLEVLSQDKEGIKNVLADWTVTAITSKAIELDLVFKDPRTIYRDYSPYVLLVFMNFSDVEDSDGINLTHFDFLKREIPPQISSKEMKDKIE